MKAVAILVFVMIAYANGNPLVRQRRGWLFPNIGISNIVSALYGGFADKAVGKDSFLGKLKQALQSKVNAVGQINADIIGYVVNLTFELLVNNKVMSIEDANKVMGTFHGGAAGQEKLTIDTVDKLTIAGDAAGATAFRAAIKKLIQENDKGYPITATMAGLELAALDLVTANGVMSTSGALNLKQYFNLCPLVTAMIGISC